MLTNFEIWYGLRENEITALEEVDRLLLRRILEVPDSTCLESLYLELGIIPIHILLKARRLNELHHLASLDENNMLYKVFITQWKYPAKDDWALKVKENLKELNINLDLNDIKKKSEYSFKKLVKIKTQEYTLNYLLELKDKHSKMEKLEYDELKLQDYLKDDDIPVAEAKNLFRFRTRSARFKENIKK